MPNQTSPMLLLVAVIALILLAVAVFVLTLVYVRHSQSKKHSRPDAHQTEQPIASQPLSPSVQQVLQPSSPLTDTPAQPGEVMRVIRDEQTGRVVIEVEGQQYAHIREIRDAQIGRRVLWAIADLIRFTGGMAANPQAVRNVAQDQESPSAAQVAGAVPDPGLDAQRNSPPPSTSAVPPVPPAAVPTREMSFQQESSSYAMPAQEPPSARDRASITGFFRRGLEPVSTQAPAPVSLIDEIEEILQERIRRLATPLREEVHVKTGVGGALQIVVGTKTYPSADHIPEPDIRQLIQAAVAEWEKR